MPKNSPQNNSDESVIESRLSEMQDITDEAKKNKVQLTPEIQAYIREHLEAVQQKLANREAVTEDDLKFMQEVRLWVSLPEELRNKYKRADEVRQCEEVQEAAKRQITPKQWLDLLYVAKVAEMAEHIFGDMPRGKEWIDDKFRFPGNNRVEALGWLDLGGCRRLQLLPSGLEATDHFDLNQDKSLTFLPDKLKVGRDLSLIGCSSLKCLPVGLKVGENLDIRNCTNLASLTDDLEVGGNLYLSEDLHEQIKIDAKRLKEEDKIKGEIIYK